MTVIKIDGHEDHDQRGAAQEQRDLLVPELCGGDT